MTEKKIQKIFVDRGFGFPVKLVNVPMVKLRGVWTPDIDYNLLAQSVLMSLCAKPGRLTGLEIRFVRLHFEMTLQDFGKRFTVSHAAVIKWERMKDRPTSMNWSTEKDLRLFVLSKLNPHPKEFTQLYQGLEAMKGQKSQLIQLDLQRLAA